MMMKQRAARVDGMVNQIRRLGRTVYGYLSIGRGWNFHLAGVIRHIVLNIAWLMVIEWEWTRR